MATCPRTSTRRCVSRVITTDCLVPSTGTLFCTQRLRNPDCRRESQKRVFPGSSFVSGSLRQTVWFPVLGLCSAPKSYEVLMVEGCCKNMRSQSHHKGHYWDYVLHSRVKSLPVGGNVKDVCFPKSSQQTGLQRGDFVPHPGTPAGWRSRKDACFPSPGKGAV